MKFLKTFIFAALLVTSSVVFFGTREAEAQAPCQVVSATFRVNRTPTPNFYLGSNKPFVYLDIGTQNCVGETIQVSIVEIDDSLAEGNAVDDDVNGNLGNNDYCTNNSSCMDNRILPVVTNDLTLALRAGEDECEWSDNNQTYHCRYYIETWDEVTGTGITDDGQEWTSGTTIASDGQGWTSGTQLFFNCDDECLDNWFYYGILENFGASHPSDPDYDPGDGSGTTGSGDGSGTTGSDDGAGTTGGTDGGSGAQTVIDLGLQNPLAGTIDTLPQLLQKIVYIFMRIAVPLIAMAILYSGFLFVTAQGRDDQLKKAKATFTLAVIGGLVLLGAYLLAEAIRDALTTINT